MINADDQQRRGAEGNAFIVECHDDLLMFSAGDVIRSAHEAFPDYTPHAAEDCRKITPADRKIRQSENIRSFSDCFPVDCKLRKELLPFCERRTEALLQSRLFCNFTAAGTGFCCGTADKRKLKRQLALSVYSAAVRRLKGNARLCPRTAESRRRA